MLDAVKSWLGLSPASSPRAVKTETTTSLAGTPGLKAVLSASSLRDAEAMTPRGISPIRGYELPLPPPKVSGILLYGDPVRRTLARKAVERFAQQTYPNKELIVVNATPENLFNGEPRPPHMVEIFATSTEHGTGKRRNIGLQASTGQWALIWDDDDYSDPKRIDRQMEAAIETKTAVTLSTQVRCVLATGAAALEQSLGGLPSTLLFPKNSGHTYPDLNVYEDQVFWIENWAANSTVIDNRHFPDSCLSIAFYHGRNLLPIGAFAPFYDSSHQSLVQLPAAETARLREVLISFGFEVTVADRAAV